MIKNDSELKMALENKAFFTNYIEKISERKYTPHVEQLEREITEKVIAKIEREINQYHKSLQSNEQL